MCVQVHYTPNVDDGAAHDGMGFIFASTEVSLIGCMPYALALLNKMVLRFIRLVYDPSGAAFLKEILPLWSTYPALHPVFCPWYH